MINANVGFDPALRSTAATTAPVELSKPAANDELRKTFDQFVGETFFSQMLASMRKSVGKPAYFHGGRGEEVFQGQLDQMLGEKLSEATAGSFSGPMFDLFTLSRK